nr:hypothetical protein Iba_chr13cCG15750 [Ipomoea batatas]
MAASTHHFLLSSPSLNSASTHVVSIKLSSLNFLSQAKGRVQSVIEYFMVALTFSINFLPLASSNKRMPKLKTSQLSDAFRKLCKSEINFSGGEESSLRRARGPKSTQSNPFLDLAANMLPDLYRWGATFTTILNYRKIRFAPEKKKQKQKIRFAPEKSVGSPEKKKHT